MSFLSRIFSFLSPGPSNAVVLAPQEFKKGMASGKHHLLDVRTPREFAGGKIKNARNLDILNKTRFLAEAKKLDKDLPVYLYCRTGNRSRSASRALTELGFEEIYDLRGGIVNWK